jgi:hypothetical protein
VDATVPDNLDLEIGNIRDSIDRGEVVSFSYQLTSTIPLFLPDLFLHHPMM